MDLYIKYQYHFLNIFYVISSILIFIVLLESNTIFYICQEFSKKNKDDNFFFKNVQFELSKI